MAEDDFERPSHGGHSTVIPPDQIGGNTRFYDKEFPDLEECVVVNVKAIAEMGAYVQLLEYNNIEGMILLSELSRRRIRSINRLVRVGRNEVVMVIRVDKDKGYIDLSKRRVSAEDIIKCEERFNKAKAVHSIVKHMSGKLRIPMLQVYQRIAWPLYKRHGHAYDAFTMAVSEPDNVLKDLEISPAERGELCEYITARMTPQPLKIRTDIQVTCFNYEGIEAVRESLLAGQALSTAAVPIKVQLIAPPLYVMTTQCLDKVAGVAALTAAIAATKKVIESKGGQLNVKMAPSVTSAQEDSELLRMLEDLEAAGAEVSGDEDSEEDSEEEEEGAHGKGEDAELAKAGGAGIEEGEGEGEEAPPAKSAGAGSAKAPKHKK